MQHWVTISEYFSYRWDAEYLDMDVFTVYSVQYTLFTVQCTLYNVCCILQFIIYIVYLAFLQFIFHTKS